MAEFTDPGDPNALAWCDFERDLTALGRSARTIQSYREACEQLADYAKGADLLTLTKVDVSGFIIEVQRAHSATTAQVRYRSQHRFYAWARGEIAPVGAGEYVDALRASGRPHEANLIGCECYA